MALPVFQRTIVTEAGDVIAGAEVEVVLESTGLAADIFSNRDGSTPLTNPFFTGADGFAKFFAAPDEYRITATGPTGSIVFRFVVLTGDSARRDVGTGATQVPTNNDLGTMSTQNANAVAITGGSASLSANGLTVGTNQIVTLGGNVGIGTSSPQAKLDVLTAGGFSVGRFDNGTSQVGIGVSSDNTTFIEVPQAQPLRFLTSGIERMRIDSGGNLLVGVSSFSSGAGGGISMHPATGARTVLFCGSTITSSSLLVAFANPNGLVGTITTSAFATAYNTSSDYRLKEDLQPVEDPIGRLKNLKPFNFAWKVDGTRVDGFLAHEAQEVVPEAVTGTKDAMRTEEYEVSPAVLDEDGTVVEEAVMGEREVPDHQGIDQAKLVPLLTAALQDAVAKIESLEQRIQALEGGQA